MKKQKYCTMFIVHFLKVSWKNSTRKIQSKIWPLLETSFLHGNTYTKYFHGEMALERKVIFLGLPDYNNVDRLFLSTWFEVLYIGHHISKGKAWIKNPKTCGSSKWPPLTNEMSYSCVRSIFMEKWHHKGRSYF